MEREKKVAGSIMLLLVGCFLAVETGTRLTYLYSDHAAYIRFGIFVALCGAFIYIGFFFKWPGGKTGMQFATQKMSSRQRVWTTSKWFLCMFAFNAAIAWMSISLMALGAKLTLGRDFMADYRVEQVDARGSTMLLLSLSGEGGRRKLLQMSRLDIDTPMNLGDSLCVYGKRSWFGVSVSEVERSSCNR